MTQAWAKSAVLTIGIRWAATALAAVASAVLLMDAAVAQPASPFYAGKVINIYIGSGESPGADARAARARRHGAAFRAGQADRKPR